MHRKFRMIGAAMIVCVIAGALLLWNFNRPPFDLDLLAHLRPGMEQPEIRRILGAPSSGFGDQWAYSRSMAWPIVYVRLDASGGS